MLVVDLTDAELDGAAVVERLAGRERSLRRARSASTPTSIPSPASGRRPPASTSSCRARAWPVRELRWSPACPRPAPSAGGDRAAARAERRVRLLGGVPPRSVGGRPRTAQPQRMIWPRARAGQRPHVCRRERYPAALADAVLIDAATAIAVFEQHRRALLGCDITVAPLHQRDDRRPQVEALLGEAVFVAGDAPDTGVARAPPGRGGGRDASAARCGRSPRSSWISSKRRRPRNTSRMISSDHRSPITSRAPATVQTWFSYSFPNISTTSIAV